MGFLLGFIFNSFFDYVRVNSGANRASNLVKRYACVRISAFTSLSGLHVRSRKALVNMFNVKNDLFAQKQVDDTTQTRFGVLLSLVVVPLCLILYSCLWFVTFYVGLGEGSPPLYKLVTTEQLQYGQQIFPLKMECIHPDGCYFRLPGADACTASTASTVVGGNEGNSDFCSKESVINRPDSSSSPPGGNDLAATTCGTAMGACCKKATCNDELSAAQGLCAFSPPGADPTDALTVAWAWKQGIDGPANFGVTLITDYIDGNGDVAQKEVKVHRGIALMNLIEHDDPKMSWSKSHPDYGANKKKTIMYEWSITMVDVQGSVDSDSNLCMNQMRADNLVTGSGSNQEVNARRVKLVPSATYTKMTTTYPSPGLTYLSAIGGISSVIMAICSVLHSFHLSLFKKNAPAVV